MAKPKAYYLAQTANESIPKLLGGTFEITETDLWSSPAPAGVVTVFASESSAPTTLHPSWKSSCVIRFILRSSAEPEGAKGARFRTLTVSSGDQTSVLREDPSVQSTLLGAVLDFNEQFRAATLLRDGLRNLHVHLASEEVPNRRIKSTDDILALTLAGESATREETVTNILITSNIEFKTENVSGVNVTSEDKGTHQLSVVIQDVKVEESLKDVLVSTASLITLVRPVGVWTIAQLCDLWDATEKLGDPDMICMPQGIEDDKEGKETIILFIRLAVQRYNTRRPVPHARESLTGHLKRIEDACSKLEIKASKMKHVYAENSGSASSKRKKKQQPQQQQQSLPESSTEERSRASAASAVTVQASKKRRTAKKKKSAPDEGDDDADDDDGFPSATAADLPPFVIESMRDIGATFPHLDMSAQCELALNKLDVAKVALSKTLANRLMRKTIADPEGVANSHADQECLATLSEYKKDLSKVQCRRLQYDQSQHVPVEMELLRDARALLVVPQYTHGEHMRSHKEASEMLRRKFLRLPLYTAEHETQLMAQHAGTWTVAGFGERTFPPCCYGTKCVGYATNNLIRGLDQRVIFMRAMSPTEWENLVLHGTQPVGTSPCVLDGRLHTTRYAAKERMGMRPGHTVQRGGGGGEGGAEPEVVFQLWRNLVGVQGGYWPQYMFFPAENEILIEPIVAFHRSALRAELLPSGMWSVLQDSMVWTAPALLERSSVGERAQDFCAGADSTKKPMPSTSLGPSASAPHRSRVCPATAVCSSSSVEGLFAAAKAALSSQEPLKL